MKILTPGKLPENMIARTTCTLCKCYFEFTRKEAKRVNDQRDGDFYTINCPTCKANCSVLDAAFRYHVDPPIMHDR